MRSKACLLFLLLIYLPAISQAQQHPSIMLRSSEIAALRSGIKTYPLLAHSYKETKALADAALKESINVPQPRDGGGGITHERHKRNYQQLLACGLAYQVTGDLKYAQHVQDVLLSYAREYGKWPLHPAKKQSNPPGRIFWQNLNDCVWQVYMIQAYDLAYGGMTVANRKTIETNLFEKVIRFLAEDNKETLNRIHNHGTWAAAAVGMTGYVMQRKDWVSLALNGHSADGNAGFLAQMRSLFSPDGYYTEGPYYQRYALLPFLLFSKTINAYEPSRKIFTYHDHVLEKAIHTALQLTYTNGAFFPFNDALKEKTYATEEMVYGVDLAYADMHAAPDLLDVARRQGRVILSGAGLKVARAIHEGKVKPFQYSSKWIRDGSKGDEGGIGILRHGSNSDQQCIVFKAAGQGMGHGHFDRLNFLYYDNGVEVFPDYGSARFLNIETKSGGEYLPENKSWAKQTIAHNTMVVDATSHHGASLEKAQGTHAQLLHFASGKDIQVVAARDTTAYPGTVLTRTLAMVSLPELEKALVLDIFQVRSGKPHRYELPYWYNGHMTHIPFAIQAATDTLTTAGKEMGYQHLWKIGEGRSSKGSESITFLHNNRFYTTRFLTDTATRIQFLASGAGDPHFNIRQEKAFLLRQDGSKDRVFISLIESHGNTNPTAETTSAFLGKITALTLVNDTSHETVFSFSTSARTYVVTLHYNDPKQFITIK